MKKIILIGRSECGKTTLRQALKGNTIQYHKTQFINNYDVVIDTPGEYAENHKLGWALVLYSFECDEVALVVSATEPYSLYPPNIAPLATRPVFGVITKIDAPDANVERAHRWLELTGCKDIFKVSSFTGDGVWEILSHLREEGDILPWETKDFADAKRTVLSTKDIVLTDACVNE